MDNGGTIICVYRASHVLEELGWVDLDLGSSPSWWATTVATEDIGYYDYRPVTLLFVCFISFQRYALS